MPPRLTIALTAGEPAGIGPELVLALGATPDVDLVVFADPSLLRERAALLGLSFAAPRWSGQGGTRPDVYVAPVSLAASSIPGQLDARNSRYVIECLQRAVQGCRSGEFQALVTGPVHKGIINDAGIPFTGHTEFLAAESGTTQVVMMLAAPDLRVALATTHMPLADVPRAITREHLTRVIQVLHADLRNRFGIANPVVLVCGLNPHAGESGYLGREEIEIIEPVLNTLRSDGMQLHGPAPADTVFLPANLSGVDAVLTMYHDQGLPVLKRHDFAHTVNITLGLPFVRTSVDHGTALELAGTGRADPSSFKAAIAMAIELAGHPPA